MTKSQLIEESRNQYITFQSGDVKCDSQFNEPMVLLPIKAFESRLSLIYDKAVEEMREKIREMKGNKEYGYEDNPVTYLRKDEVLTIINQQIRE